MIQSDGSLPTRAINKSELNCSNFIDFRGVRFGSFTVIARHKHLKTWVVRCRCGEYETRKSKSIRNNINDKCRCCNEDN